MPKFPGWTVPLVFLCGWSALPAILSAWVLLGYAPSRYSQSGFLAGRSQELHSAAGHAMNQVSCLGRWERPAPRSFPGIPNQAFWSGGATSYTQQWARLWISSHACVKQGNSLSPVRLFVVLTQADPLRKFLGQTEPLVLLCRRSALPAIFCSWVLPGSAASRCSSLAFWPGGAGSYHSALLPRWGKNRLQGQEEDLNQADVYLTKFSGQTVPPSWLCR